MFTEHAIKEDKMDESYRTDGANRNFGKTSSEEA
jgi:hypothetical protein